MNKQINADSRISDRFIYNEAVSIKNTLIKQEEDKQRLYGSTQVFKVLNKVELIEVDTIEACGFKSDCYIRRTKYALPKILEGTGGPYIRSVTSIDGASIAIVTTDRSFIRKLNINDKHAKKEVLFYILGDYGYFPNVTWDYARIDAAFEDEDEIDSLNSCDDKVITCTPMYERSFSIPNYLEKPLKDLLNNSLLNYYHRLQEDTQINKTPVK